MSRLAAGTGCAVPRWWPALRRTGARRLPSGSRRVMPEGWPGPRRSASRPQGRCRQWRAGRLPGEQVRALLRHRQPGSRAIQADNPDRAVRHAADELAGDPAAGPAVLPTPPAARRANVVLGYLCGIHAVKIADLRVPAHYQAISPDGI